MKIVIDGIIYTWYPNGGIGVYFNEIMSHLDINSIKYNFVDYRAGSISNLNPRFLERYRSFNGACDGALFHSTYYRLPSTRPKAVVTTVHDFTYERIIGGVKALVHRLQKNRAIQGSDKIICVSQSTKNDLLYYCPDVPEEKIAIIHNGVSEDYYQINGAVKSNSVVFVGGRSSYKNFPLAIQAIAAVSDLNLVIVGGGELSAFEHDLLNKNLHGRFSHVLRASNEELNHIYNTAFCLLYPSCYEGFGIPIIEAMRAGCPVIAVSSSSIPEIALNQSALLCGKADADEMIHNLHCLFDVDFRSKLIERGFDNAARFSWRDTAQKTISVYKEFF